MVAAFHLDKPEVMKYIHNLEEQALAGGIGKSDVRAAASGSEAKAGDKSSNELASTDSGIKHFWKAHEDGCDNCNNSGYRGRDRHL